MLSPPDQRCTASFPAVECSVLRLRVSRLLRSTRLRLRCRSRLLGRQSSTFPLAGRASTTSATACRFTAPRSRCNRHSRCDPRGPRQFEELQRVRVSTQPGPRTVALVNQHRSSVEQRPGRGGRRPISAVAECLAVRFDAKRMIGYWVVTDRRPQLHPIEAPRRCWRDLGELQSKALLCVVGALVPELEYLANPPRGSRPPIRRNGRRRPATRIHTTSAGRPKQ